MTWHDEAICVGATDLFFDERRIAIAKTVCARCPVRAECLDENLEERYGVVGGTSPRERRRLRRGMPVREGRGWSRTVRDEAERLIGRGWQDRHVADRTGVAQRTVLQWRRDMGIKLGSGGRHL